MKGPDEVLNSEYVIYKRNVYCVVGNCNIQR
jgi:hypothetical protein